MSQNLSSAVAVVGVDIGKNSFHVVGQDAQGAIVLRQKWSRGQVEARLANMPPCLIGMEACVGAHHLSRKLKAFGHDARLMPAKYVRPYSKGQKNDFRDAEAIAEAVQAAHQANQEGVNFGRLSPGSGGQNCTPNNTLNNNFVLGVFRKLYKTAHSEHLWVGLPWWSSERHSCCIALKVHGKRSHRVTNRHACH